MDKELILEAVNAVIEFNLIQGELSAFESKIASIDVGRFDIRISIHNGSNFDLYKHGTTNEDLKNFINKLKELGEKWVI